MNSIHDFDTIVLTIFKRLLDEFPSKDYLKIDEIYVSVFGEMPDIATSKGIEENREVLESRKIMIFSAAEWLGAEGYLRFDGDDFAEPSYVTPGRLPAACLTAKALAILRVQVESLEGRIDLATEASNALRDGARNAISASVSRIISLGAGLGLA